MAFACISLFTSKPPSSSRSDNHIKHSSSPKYIYFACDIYSDIASLYNSVHSFQDCSLSPRQGFYDRFHMELVEAIRLNSKTGREGGKTSFESTAAQAPGTGVCLKTTTYLLGSLDQKYRECISDRADNNPKTQCWGSGWSRKHQEGPGGTVPGFETSPTPAPLRDPATGRSSGGNFFIARGV